MKRFAPLLVSAVVLLGYLVSLAPSVTFWDAGEFIAAMKTLGIPHPPGTPLFVLVGHVWGMLIPVGEFAFRTNLLSALFSAAGAGFWFLVLREAALGTLAELPERARDRLANAAGAAGTLIASFGFTHWLNSNETEVYAVATFTIAVVCWLLLRWRSSRGTPRAGRYLLLSAYLLGIAIGNHLLGLLVGPAVITFMVVELRRHPAGDPGTARREWAGTALVAGLWLLLTGIGLGSAGIIAAGALVFLGAMTLAARAGQAGFGILLLGLALVGVTPYLYLYIRSGQGPMINEAAPATWEALVQVIRRAQYELRTPFDDPTMRHGPDNPGRNLTIVGLQLLNYIQYFDWQWAKGLPGAIGNLPVRTLVTLAFLSLGLGGFAAHRRADPVGSWLLLTLFLVTGLGLVAYMNFKPGFSVGYGLYPDGEQHEVRERDYFFVVSFIVWGLWAGLGLLKLVRDGMRSAVAPLRRMAPAIFLAAVVPFALNYPEASRRHGPDARLPGDFAYDLLNSVPPYGILFTYGDNDTFPLWWAQEVAGIRKDVTVICLALAETEWYMRQLRDHPVRAFEAAAAPAIWQGGAPAPPTWPLHTMTDAEIAAALPQVLDRAATLRFGAHDITLPAGTVLYGKDFLALRVIQQNFGRRPIVWGLTAASSTYGLDRFLVQRGIGIVLEPAPVDTTSAAYDLHRLMGAPLDLAATDRLMLETYRYGRLTAGPRPVLETTSSGIASTLGLPFTQLAYAMEARGDTVRMLRYLERAAALSTNPAIRQALEQLRRAP